MKRLIGSALAAACVALPATAAAAVVPSVSANQNPGTRALARTPAEIEYSGDGAAFLAGAHGTARHPTHITWTVWNRSGARGTGANWLDSCKPNCAAGTYRAYPVQVHLYRPETVSGHLTFTRMSFVYTNPDLIPTDAAYATEKGGIWQTDLVLKYAYGNFFWN